MCVWAVVLLLYTMDKKTLKGNKDDYWKKNNISKENQSL